MVFHGYHGFSCRCCLDSPRNPDSTGISRFLRAHHSIQKVSKKGGGLIVDRQIVSMKRMLQRWKAESDRFFARPENANYEPNGDVSHIWANFQSATDTVADVLLDFEEV